MDKFERFRVRAGRSFLLAVLYYYIRDHEKIQTYLNDINRLDQYLLGIKQPNGSIILPTDTSFPSLTFKISSTEKDKSFELSHAYEMEALRSYSQIYDLALTVFLFFPGMVGPVEKSIDVTISLFSSPGHHFQDPLSMYRIVFDDDTELSTNIAEYLPLGKKLARAGLIPAFRFVYRDNDEIYSSKSF